MASLLIIGGSGFFGRSILDAFQRDLLKPWAINKIIIFARHPEILLKECPMLIDSRVELIVGDISLTNYLPEADYVIHAAASTDLRDYLSKPDQEKTNIEKGTQHYCELALEYHKNSKIVYISSGAVYGPQPKGMDKLSEDYDSPDISLLSDGKRDYALAKRASENIVQSFRNRGLIINIARCFAFIGPWLPRDQHFAIGNFIDDILNKRPIKVFADHYVYRSYMYADDLVHWLMSIIEYHNGKCSIFNVGSDESIEISNLALKLADLYSLTVQITPKTSKKIDRYIPSTKKAKSEFGLSLNFNLMHSIQETIKQINTYQTY